MGRRERARARRPEDDEAKSRFVELARRVEALDTFDDEARSEARSALVRDADRSGLRWLMFARPKLGRDAVWILGRLGVDDDTGEDLEALLRCRLDELTWGAAATALSLVAPERARQIVEESPGTKLGKWLAASRETPDTDPAPPPISSSPTPSSTPAPGSSPARALEPAPGSPPESLAEPSASSDLASPESAPAPDLSGHDQWLFASHDRAYLLRWALALEVFRFVRADPRDPVGNRDRLACAFAIDGSRALGELTTGPSHLFGEPVRLVRAEDRWILEVDDGGRVSDADFARALRIEQRLPLEKLTVLEPPIDSPLCVSRKTRPDLFR